MVVGKRDGFGQLVVDLVGLRNDLVEPGDQRIGFSVELCCGTAELGFWNDDARDAIDPQIDASGILVESAQTRLQPVDGVRGTVSRAGYRAGLFGVTIERLSGQFDGVTGRSGCYPTPSRNHR